MDSNTLDQITRERIVDCVLAINALENIVFADASFLGSFSKPFDLKHIIKSHQKTMEVNSKIREIWGFDS